jgi:mannose/fructose/N-acetylgalactosamine-specific phosphotransferase system component IID
MPISQRTLRLAFALEGCLLGVFAVGVAKFGSLVIAVPIVALAFGAAAGVLLPSLMERHKLVHTTVHAGAAACGLFMIGALVVLLINGPRDARRDGFRPAGTPHGAVR